MKREMGVRWDAILCVEKKKKKTDEPWIFLTSSPTAGGRREIGERRGAELATLKLGMLGSSIKRPNVVNLMLSSFVLVDLFLFPFFFACGHFPLCSLNCIVKSDTHTMDSENSFPLFLLMPFRFRFRVDFLSNFLAGCIKKKMQTTNSEAAFGKDFTHWKERKKTSL
jgi:hypothetical protein